MRITRRLTSISPKPNNRQTIDSNKKKPRAKRAQKLNNSKELSPKNRLLPTWKRTPGGSGDRDLTDPRCTPDLNTSPSTPTKNDRGSVGSPTTIRGKVAAPRPILVFSLPKRWPKFLYFFWVMPLRLDCKSASRRRGN